MSHGYNHSPRFQPWGNQSINQFAKPFQRFTYIEFENKNNAMGTYSCPMVETMGYVETVEHGHENNLLAYLIDF